MLSQLTIFLILCSKKRNINLKSPALHKFNRETLSEVKELLNKVNGNIVITTHYNPDGDALGSALALGRYLEKAGKQVSIVIPNDFPDFLKWMPGQENAIIYFHHANKANELLEKAEVIFCLDYNAVHRVNYFGKQLFEAGGVKILIDHHIQPEPDFDYMFSVIETSSTSELVYDFICGMGDSDLIDTEISISLYVGIMTDTGSFNYGCNYPHTFEVVAELIRRGIDVEQIHRLVYDTYSEKRMRLLGFCLSERMTVLEEYATAYIWLSEEDMQKFDFKPGDSEGIVNYALSIKGVSFAAFFTEKPDRIRISFRSKGDFSVNTFARLHFEGGGHRNASGGDSFMSLTETLEKFTALLPQYAEELNLSASKSAVLTMK